MVLIGKEAPSFEATAVEKGKTLSSFTLDQYLGNYLILFFYPLDFTFVCPTELHAFQDQHQAFLARQARVVGCSVDSPFAHLAWLNTPKSKGGIEGIQYPLISDLNQSIARAYGVFNEEEGVAFRGLFLIDRQGVIRHQLINDLPLGRSVDETLRLLDALIFHEKHGEVCPANWMQGSVGIKTTQASVAQYLTASSSSDD
ncbi:MAG: peroxiredoxin [Chlamydiota bacterium]|nr:peroxiredoxin [Chlamydiota bacterium]